MVQLSSSALTALLSISAIVGTLLFQQVFNSPSLFVFKDTTIPATNGPLPSSLPILLAGRISWREIEDPEEHYLCPDHVPHFGCQQLYQIQICHGRYLR